MENQITFNGETKTFTKFTDAEEAIISEIRMWNNFHPEELLVITIKKIPSEVPTLGVVAAENINVTEILR